MPPPEHDNDSDTNSSDEEGVEGESDHHSNSDDGVNCSRSSEGVRDSQEEDGGGVEENDEKEEALEGEIGEVVNPHGPEGSFTEEDEGSEGMLSKEEVDAEDELRAKVLAASEVGTEQEGDEQEEQAAGVRGVNFAPHGNEEGSIGGVSGAEVDGRGGHRYIGLGMGLAGACEMSEDEGADEAEETEKPHKAQQHLSLSRLAQVQAVEASRVVAEEGEGSGAELPLHESSGQDNGG